MFNIGPSEAVVILVLALIVLGPERLPELARGIGKFLREFRKQTDDVRNVVEREFYKMDEHLRSEEAKLNAAFQPPVLAPPASATVDAEGHALPAISDEDKTVLEAAPKSPLEMPLPELSQKPLSDAAGTLPAFRPPEGTVSRFGSRGAPSAEASPAKAAGAKVKSGKADG